MTQEISRSPPRIALVTGVLHLGGTTSFLCNFGGELVRRNVPVRVLSFERGNPMAEDFDRLKIPVTTWDERRWIFEDRLLRILAELAAFKPTAVVANLSCESFEVLRYLPRGVCRVGTAQSHDPGAFRTVRCYAGQVDLMAAVSRQIADDLQELPEFAGVQVRYLPLGVPMPGADSVARRRFAGPLRILYLGRVDREQKRAHLFPMIFEQLKASGIPFHWTIAGEGTERRALEQAMTSPDDQQTVSFPGKIAYAAVPELLAGHDVFLLASDYEGLPLSLVEAMASGLVPVVSDLKSGVRELVDESSGRLVAPNDVNGFAQAIIWLHAHRDDMRQQAHRARERVERDFSVGAMTDRWLAALPRRPAQEIAWPTAWTIRPILESTRPWRFSPPVRALRRALRRSMGAVRFIRGEARDAPARPPITARD